MKHKGFATLCLTLTGASIYLLVRAPAPLEAVDVGVQATIPIERVFDAVNAINARARQIYTKEIVGAGKAIGLAFNEDWQEATVKAGPLPALFLRSTAAALERDPFPLGLFLGSDYPINASNRFNPEQLARFEQVKTDGRPRYGRVEGEGTIFGMYADVASAEPCVSCHNGHRDTPKSDWRLNDIMGATTWTFPRPMVSADEYVGMIDGLYRAIATAYDLYLAEVETFDRKPVLGDQWPRDGFFLPSGEIFMATLRAATAADALATLARDLAAARSPLATGVGGAAAPGPAPSGAASRDTRVDSGTSEPAPAGRLPSSAPAYQGTLDVDGATTAAEPATAVPAAAGRCLGGDERELCF